MLSGLTIAAGSADVPGCFGQPYTNSVGGAITCLNEANLTIADCAFINNRAFCAGGAIAGGEVHLIRCTFTANRATGPGIGVGGALSVRAANAIECVFQSSYAGNVAGGCAIGWYGSTTRFERCRFVGNHAAESSGAIQGDDIILIDSEIVGNSSAHWCAGVRGSNLRIFNCTFIGNGASIYCLYQPGSALLAESGSNQIVNCLFAGNSGGCGIIGVAGETSIFNCTVAGNTPADSPSAVWADGQTSFANSIIWGNQTWHDEYLPSVPVVAGGSTTINNSVIQQWDGSLGGEGNHGNDPRFVDPANGDYRLLANSPCIDRGDNQALPPDEFDLDGDGDTTEPLPLDLDLLPRTVNAAVDMGAFEFQGIPCPADITGDGEANFDDVLAVLAEWGQCANAAPCNSDLTLDGMVNFDDALLVLMSWGPCP